MLKTLLVSDLAKYFLRRHVCPALEFAKYSSKLVKAEDPFKNPRITLINADDNVSILNLSEAQALSKTKSLKLVKITDLDVKTRRPLYRLISSENLLKAQIKSRIEKKEAKKEWAIKGEKKIEVSAKIADHDFQTSCKRISTWLDKCYSVRIIIKGESSLDNAEKLFTRLTRECGENCKTQQKSSKGNNLKFNLVPIPPKIDDPIAMNEPKVELNGNEEQKS